MQINQGRKMGRGSTPFCNLRFSDEDRKISKRIEALKEVFFSRGVMAPDLYKLIVQMGISNLETTSENLLKQRTIIELQDLTPDLFRKETK